MSAELLDVTTLDYLAKLAQLIGIPVAIVVYGINKRRERLEREYGTYDALDERYIDYLKLCLANPDLDVADVPKKNQKKLTPEQQHRECVPFHILVSIMERAYLMYHDKSDRVRHSQWTGWDEFIREWCQRRNFARSLPLIVPQFDEGFREYIEQLPAK